MLKYKEGEGGKKEEKEGGRKEGREARREKKGKEIRSTWVKPE